MSQCKVCLENYSGIYYAGSDIRGRVECYFDEEVTLRSIKIEIIGKEHNEWTGTETYRDSDNKTQTRYITLTGNRHFLDRQKTLHGSGNGSHHLSRGRHVYPFSFSLPYDIPSSFNGPYGAIQYKVKAVVDRPMRFDYEDTFIIEVKAPIDFTRMSRDLQTPSTYSDEKSVCCWCCAGGNISMDVELSKIAFTPAEVIPFKVTICNLSNTNVDGLNVRLRKTLTYKVESPQSESKTDEEEIFSMSEHGVGAHGEHTYDLELRIPHSLEVPNFKLCQFFEVAYNMKVEAEMAGCTLDLDVEIWDIEFGNIQVPSAPLPPQEEFQQGVSQPGYPQPGYSQPPAGYPQPGYSQPPAGYPQAPGFYVPGFPAPTAPSASNPSAPPDYNPKAKEAGEASAPPSFPAEAPPPSYDEIHP